jgi:mannose-6-phosphate isomerase-like protein (cupin superfamily)
MDVEKPEIERPWGGFAVLVKTQFFWIKKLFVNKEARFSLQSHKNRSEVWLITRGSICAEIGGEKHIAEKGDILFVPKEKKHRITGIEEACIMEFAYGIVFENDIIRYEDDYGRASVPVLEEKL